MPDNLQPISETHRGRRRKLSEVALWLPYLHCRMDMSLSPQQLSILWREKWLEIKFKITELLHITYTQNALPPFTCIRLQNISRWKWAISYISAPNFHILSPILLELPSVSIQCAPQPLKSTHCSLDLRSISTSCVVSQKTFTFLNFHFFSHKTILQWKDFLDKSRQWEILHGNGAEERREGKRSLQVKTLRGTSADCSYIYVYLILIFTLNLWTKQQGN